MHTSFRRKNRKFLHPDTAGFHCRRCLRKFLVCNRDRLLKKLPITNRSENCVHAIECHFSFFHFFKRAVDFQLSHLSIIDLKKSNQDCCHFHFLTKKLTLTSYSKGPSEKPEKKASQGLSSDSSNYAPVRIQTKGTLEDWQAFSARNVPKIDRSGRRRGFGEMPNELSSSARL